MIKVLHIVPSLDGGGIENLILNYYTYMNKKEFLFDIIVHGDHEGVLESKFRDMGSNIYHIITKRDDFWGNIKSMNKIIKNGNYDVVHVHQRTIGVIPMFLSKKAGVKMRITHSHSASRDSSFVKKIFDLVFLPFLKLYSTNWLACGTDAAISLWGKKAVQHNKVHILKNAIDLDKFARKPEVRNQKRKEFGIEDKLVIGQVGRFSIEKNHEFIINVFNEVHKSISGSVLLLVGRGELEEKIKKQVRELGLNESVIFLGIRNDVHEILQSMDVFMLPSLSEGLPVVLIEAQAAQIKSIASDVITKEVKITNLLRYIPLKESYEYWAETTIDIIKEDEPEYSVDQIKYNGYDVKIEVKKLEKFYQMSLQ